LRGDPSRASPLLRTDILRPAHRRDAGYERDPSEHWQRVGDVGADLGHANLRRPRTSAKHRDLLGPAGGRTPRDPERPTGCHPPVGHAGDELSAHWTVVIADTSAVGARKSE